jgi:methylenetetrahydrofolate reductase (NADPH)
MILTFPLYLIHSLGLQIFTEILKNATETKVSFEILPPLKGKSIQSLFNILDPLMEFNPPFIDVTYHREDFIYKLMPSGYYEKVAIRKRPGTVGICAAIMNKYNVEAVPHLICGGFTVEETEDALIEKFCIGVAGYPEKHFEAPNLFSDIKWLKAKIDAGANYIVTQMFFDNQKYFDFVKLCRDNGITVPIIPGLKMFNTKKQLTILPKIFHIDIPQELYEAVVACKDDKQVKEVGIQWCIKQSQELMKANVPCLHYYTMGTAEATRRVAKEVF